MFSVRNEPNSPVAPAENVELVFTSPKALICIPASGWKVVTLRPDTQVTNKIYTLEQSWKFPFPPILAGVGEPTAPVLIAATGKSPCTYFSLLVRAKDCPAKVLAFLVVPISLSSNSPPHKAFVLKGIPAGDPHGLRIPQKELLENLMK
jgi:hypothetical protein